jgi:predicted 3-demethylubiquinone-9 3-methyltransferase (glyoxalase superfamily)
MEDVMPKITPNLWFNTDAEEAARFYVSLLPDSHVDAVNRAAADNPSGPAGSVVTVDFTLAGQRFTGINGGPQYPFTEAVSFAIECDDQAEVDRLWAALTANGGEPGRCGWLRDRFGLSWQVIPKALGELMGSSDPDGSRRAMEALLGMSKIDVEGLRRAYRGAAIRS